MNPGYRACDDARDAARKDRRTTNKKGPGSNPGAFSVFRARIRLPSNYFFAFDTSTSGAASALSGLREGNTFRMPVCTSPTSPFLRNPFMPNT